MQYGVILDGYAEGCDNFPPAPLSFCAKAQVLMHKYILKKLSLKISDEFRPHSSFSVRAFRVIIFPGFLYSFPVHETDEAALTLTREKHIFTQKKYTYIC